MIEFSTFTYVAIFAILAAIIDRLGIFAIFRGRKR